MLNDSEAMKGINNTLPIKDVNPADFKIIFFPGGHGPMFDLADDATTNKATTAIYENGGIVCAVCHGTVGKEFFFFLDLFRGLFWLYIFKVRNRSTRLFW